RTRGGSQLAPPFVVREKYACCTNDAAWKRPRSDGGKPGGETKRSHPAYTKFESNGSAVIDCLSSPFVLSSATATGAPHASPPFVDFDTRTALCVSNASKVSEIA